MGEEIESKNIETARNDEKIKVNLSIAERVYPFRIKPADEEKVRKAARMIKEKVMYFKQKYVNRDAQDALAMATLQFVLKLIDAEEKNNGKTIKDELDDLCADIENYLQIHEKK
jgi:cell division protein ZapA